MCEENRGVLEVDFRNVMDADPTLGFFLPEAPREMLAAFVDGLKKTTLSYFPDYEGVTKEYFVRIAHLPVLENIRNLRQFHLNQLVSLGSLTLCFFER